MCSAPKSWRSKSPKSFQENDPIIAPRRLTPPAVASKSPGLPPSRRLAARRLKGTEVPIANVGAAGEAALERLWPSHVRGHDGECGVNVARGITQLTHRGG
jgi:hypothetical protein